MEEFHHEDCISPENHSGPCPLPGGKLAEIEIDVRCYGLPVSGFPVHLVDPGKDQQIVHVPYIQYKRTVYGDGAYVLLKKRPAPEHTGCFDLAKAHNIPETYVVFDIQDVAIQSHLLVVRT